MEEIYIASSPDGDIPLGPEFLSAPFRLSLEDSHPFLSLGDYLRGVRDFLVEDGCSTISRILSNRAQHEILPATIGALLIRTEKHGTLYHVASVELQAGTDHFKFCSSMAFSDQAQCWLKREIDTLKELHRRFGLPHLPAPVIFGKTFLGHGDRKVCALLLLSEWLEGCHEWHLSAARRGEPPKVRIWDQAEGYRWASERESRSLFWGATRILSQYYDPDRYTQIKAWHHAAGDFVVRPLKHALDVRLTTARAYAPLPGLSPDYGIIPAVAMIYFFLNTILRMRLDREDGVGEPLWAGDDALEAAVKGFFAGMARPRLSSSPENKENTKMIDLFRSFSPKELIALHRPILEFMEDEAAGDRALIESRLDDHVRALHRVLLRVHESGLRGA